MDEQRVLRLGTLALVPLGLVLVALGLVVGNTVMTGVGVGVTVLGGVLSVVFRRADFDPASLGRGGRATTHALTTSGLFGCLAYLFESGPILIVPPVGAAAVGTLLGLLTVAVQSLLFGRDPLGRVIPLPTAVSFVALLLALPAACLSYAVVTVVGGTVAVDWQAVK